MSGSIDILHPEQPKQIWMVVANPVTSPVTGWRVGFWASDSKKNDWRMHILRLKTSRKIT